MKIEGKTILITGGTSGIGRALVEQLAPNNETVIVMGRNQPKLEELESLHSNIRTYKCSLNSKSDVEGVISSIIEKHPQLSIVVNNAGVQFAPTFLEDSFHFDSIENEITTNLTAPIWICSLVLGHMLSLNAPSAIVNVTSGLAIFPKTNSAVYGATKAGLHSFSQSFRYQLEETSVRVYEALLPMVDTKMTEGRGKNKLSAYDAAKAIIRGIEADKKENYIGKAQLIPIVSRFSPSLMASIMKSG
jgi:uncharacterized oxidoreductase